MLQWSDRVVPNGILAGGRRSVLGLLLLTVVMVGGCRKPVDILPATFLPDGSVGVPEEPTPPYSEVVHRYNDGVRYVDRLWSETRVQMRWRDDRGRARMEQGDGKLLFIRPDRLALTVEKLGRTYLWTGSDDERFWMFDNQENVAFVGHHRNVGRACMSPMPLPVHPSVVPFLMGWMPLDPGGWVGVGGEPEVEWLRGHYLVEPPELRLRLLLDPRTLRPVRVDLTDELGRSVVIAQLSEYASLEIDGLPQDQWPTVATRADLFVVGEEARMTLELRRQSDGVRGNRIASQAFDFDVLVRAHRPREVVRLDADCE
jgi:hypothetical protein